MTDIKETFQQEKNKEYVNNVLGREIWTLICGNKTLNSAKAAFWCGLIKKENIDSVYTNIGWDVSAIRQSLPGFEGNGKEYIYKNNLLDYGLESIIYYREFYGTQPNYVEISQELVLLFDLRYDLKKHSYCMMHSNGEMEEVIRYLDDTTVEIKSKLLYQYAAAKQMVVLLFFDIRMDINGVLSDYTLEKIHEDYKTEQLFYEFWTGNMNTSQRAFSVLMGKKVIKPLPVEKCEIWPYEQERSYEEFKIGIDEYGNEIKYTCNPSKLNDYFESNPGAPMYLTPVTFKKEVLQRYLAKPNLFEIREGYLGCRGLWGIEIDNHHKDCVIVYLGDIGRDLPEQEQVYWKSFNIVGEESLSMEAFQRDFLNMSVESSMADHQFVSNYDLLNKKWEKQYGWKFFVPLFEEDQYNLLQIRIPIVDAQPEFDSLILSLVKVLIDSINEKELKIESEKDIKGIGKLEKWFQKQGYTDYEKHIKFLKDLQRLRSTGTGHRKGDGYTKIAEKFELNTKSFIDVYENILNLSNDFLIYMLHSIK